MDEVKTRIKRYALLIDNSMQDDDRLDFCVDSVIDSALAYTSRDSLVYDYEEDLIDYPIENPANNDYWAVYELPIPKEIERKLARIITQVYKSINADLSDEGQVTSITDNGQSVSFSNKKAVYTNTDMDNIIFNSMSVLDRYRIATTIRQPRIKRYPF